LISAFKENIESKEKEVGGVKLKWVSAGYHRKRQPGCKNADEIAMQEHHPYRDIGKKNYCAQKGVRCATGYEDPSMYGSDLPFEREYLCC